MPAREWRANGMLWIVSNRRQFAGVIAALMLLTIALGSIVTTLRTAGPLWQVAHAGAGIVVGLLSFVLAVWCLPEKQPLQRYLGILLALLTGLEAAPGNVFLHAFFAPVLFSTVTVVWLLGPGPAVTANKPLRGLVGALPFLVLLQNALGAAHRHQMIGVALHIAGAMLVAGYALVVCVLLLQRLPNYPLFRRYAVTLICLVLLQVSLGITVFVLRLLDMDTHPALAIAAAAHVSGSALILAVSSVLALQYQRVVI
jgi:heme A synthase